MASSPALKIYTAEGEYVGSAKDVIGASVMVQVYGEGSTIRLGHSKKAIAWTQGADGDATESYDGTGITMCQRFPQFAYLIRYQNYRPPPANDGDGSRPTGGTQLLRREILAQDLQEWQEK